MGKLEGKVALITGAANGLGKAVAQFFASEGAKVSCADIFLKESETWGNDLLVPSPSPINIPRIYGDSLNTVVSEIQEAGGAAIGVQADISDEDSCDHLIWNTKRLLGPVDILVNVAVLTYFVPVTEFPTKWWERCFAVNLNGVFILCKKVLPHMMKQKSGAIVNITSEAAVGPGRGPYNPEPESRTIIGPPTVYATTKAAVERFTQGLAEEVYPYGVSVSAVAPSNTVSTPGAKYLKIDYHRSEPPEMMTKAILLLATEPQDKVTGRVTYSQAILKEFGWISEGQGVGIDFKGTGYSQI
ncbi:SDR family NAD(P)-dependent oxidoreductase [Deltaproteobacteria bacterium]|nr:SDR family NAD(P)-dependent oxidoreductase [Deltaproteobacteria bacterium]